ncbi:MAG TPA: hypothetical protein VFO41_06575 [Alphaproteobacteria bacterium]|nr:hypothetical protein [Alphaproteobacteria bacterium]
MISPVIKVYLKPEISNVTSLEMLRQMRHRASGLVLLYRRPGLKCFCFRSHPDVDWLIRNWGSAVAGSWELPPRI